MVSTQPVSIANAKNATKWIFLICGIAISSWALMVPYAKERLQLNDTELGLLLLLLGGGAIIIMPLTGFFIGRYGSKVVIIASSVVLAIILPLLLILDTALSLGTALFIFGAAIGAVDVAMNAHAIHIQHLVAKPIMSSLHGLFSVGGLIGSLGLGLLIKMGLQPIVAAVVISLGLLLIVVTQHRFLLLHHEEKNATPNGDVDGAASTGRKFSWLRRSIFFLGLLCFIVFLAEGAMLDWSAVFLKENRGTSNELAGIDYAAFSVAMAVMRLLGDKLIASLEGKKVVIFGSLLGAAGLLLAVLTPWLATAILGFVLLGLGAANIVPVLFSESGRVANVPPSVAISAVATFGYAGQLAGPASLGFIAGQTSLPAALGVTAFLMLLVGISYFFKK